MGNGPFTSYVGPGVFTRTKTDRTLPTLLAGTRLPCIMGVGREYNQADDESYVRGSSAIVDTFRKGEDVSSQMTGSNTSFTVTHTPIVTGAGIGATTTDPDDVRVTVNGTEVDVLSVAGSTGVVTLVTAPEADDTVLIDYYFNRTDTLVTDEDISNQADGSTLIFYVANRPVVDGNNNGLTTNNVSDVTVKVDGTAVTVSDLDGSEGKITLSSAPGASTTVTVTYYYNTYRDTAEYLQNLNVSQILRVGNSPRKVDYDNGTDYALILDDNGVGKIDWGNSIAVSVVTHTTGKEYLDLTQITATPVGYRIFMEAATGTVNGTNKTFTISSAPTKGDGTGKTTDDPTLLHAYVGATVDAARSNEVNIAYIDGSTKTVVLEDAPVAGNVYITYWKSYFGNDTYTLEVTTAGAAGVGQFTITPTTADFVSGIAEGTNTVSDPDFASEGVTWNSQPRTVPGYSVNETIYIDFTSETAFTVSSSAGASGSSGSGVLGQTYEDARTGVRFTVGYGTNVTYHNGDQLQLIVTQSPTLTAGSSTLREIPGVNLVVSTLANTGVGDTSTLTCYELVGDDEPDVGDIYYVTYKYDKTAEDLEGKVFYAEDLDDIYQMYGDISVENKVSLGAWLAINNGAPGVIIKQVLKATGSTEPAYQSWVDALVELEKPLDGNYRPAVIIPMTTDGDVQSALKKHCEVQSSMRYRNECIGFIGFAVGTDIEEVRTLVDGTFESERITPLYPDGGVIEIVDEYGVAVEHSVDGSFVAAAYSGIDTNDAYTVADPNTRRTLTGFTRLNRVMTEREMDEVAAVGVTVIIDEDPVMKVRHARTSYASDPLLVEQNIVEIADLVQQLTRKNLDRFIGTKYMPKVNEEISATVSGMFDRLIDAEYVTDYKNVKVITDANAPDTARVSAEYKPVFALNWIVVTYTLRARL